ncbi:polyphosphate kinase 1 [Planctomicrobium piriforme]|uniref:Polyphosphate kinase n=1 Tax=Planctomicrobium piriforme TaxID=1576369 RepID=A0A1I3P449_9PLAN|nr:polyphosphate kinase 1 [Planctomicrobium piriforme]SFJ16323.1 polyphosphate kinase [Planctomicrobium piriforme]
MSTDSATVYFDRELSWLEFNQRVLNEALDPQVPLLERLKFLAISSSNLDEFFRVRVGALATLVEAGAIRPAPSGLTPQQQLDRVRERIARMVADQFRCYLQEMVPLLAEQGIQRLLPQQLNTTQRRLVRQIFEQEIFSVLTPMAIEEGVPFPLLANQVLSICVRLPPIGEGDQPDAQLPRFAIIPVGKSLSRFITVPSEKGLAYMQLEDVIAMSIEEFFPGEDVDECIPFRLTRNAEVEVQELTPYGLAWNMADVLRARTSADCIRLEIEQSASPEITEFLKKQLDVTDLELMRVPGPVDLGSLIDIATRRGFENLKDEPWPPVNSTEVPSEELMFDILAERDVLLYHPYESYEPVVRLIEEAADDPDVISIKQTLYRISRDSQIVKALLRAVENGKHVTVLLELKARFDEERNLKQAHELEARGAQVIYGVKGLKTHAKVCIIVRREPHGIQRYLHFGTGNYNETTARLYSDASLLTSNEDLGVDALSFFNAIAGYSQPPYSYRKLSAAPLRLRDTLQELVEAEIGRQRDGDEARIILKLNALTDTSLINSLYQASKAGVEILLNIRGVCCLKPGVPGLSENIRVVSVVDRFLEHARILYFHHGGDPKLFISSADWMARNLDHRKELLVPVESEGCRRRLLSILETYFKDNVKSSLLQPDGTYQRIRDTESPAVRAQEELYRQARETVRRMERRRRTVFEPHRPEV